MTQRFSFARCITPTSMAAAMRGATAPHAPRAYGKAAVSTSARRSAGACAATSNNASRVGGDRSSYAHGRKRRSDVNGEKQSHRSLSPSDFTVAASRSISRGRRGGHALTNIAAVINPVSETQGVDDRATATAEKVGILLLNLGGPEKLADVQPFLYNLFADPDIIRLPAAVQFLQSPLAALLSNSRAPKSREAYESIGGGSPLRRITVRGGRLAGEGGRGRVEGQKKRGIFIFSPSCSSLGQKRCNCFLPEFFFPHLAPHEIVLKRKKEKKETPSPSDLAHLLRPARAEETLTQTQPNLNGNTNTDARINTAAKEKDKRVVGMSREDLTLSGRMSRRRR